ncbi:MAG: hypothetical protein NXI24_04915 [bacterium]|nr:hypothetical protein [bacterium]
MLVDFFVVFRAVFLAVFFDVFLDGALLLFLEAAFFFLLTDLDFFLVAIQRISTLRRIDQSIILSTYRFQPEMADFSGIFVTVCTIVSSTSG